MRTPHYLIILLIFFAVFSCRKETKSIDNSQNPVELVESSAYSNTNYKIQDSERTDDLEVQEKILANSSSKKETIMLNESIPISSVVKTTEVKVAKKTIPNEPMAVKITSKAIILFENTTYNFGDINQGDIIDYDYKFTNSGSTPLVIISVSATCGCTQPSYPFIPIEANESGVIGVRFNSTGKLGGQKPIITVTTNAKPSTIKLYLEGNVLENAIEN